MLSHPAPFLRPVVAYARPAYRKPTVSMQVKHALLNQRTAGYLGVEKKFIDTERDAAIVPTVAGSEADPTAALCLNAIEQGDGPSQREGRKATIQSVELRGSVTFNTGTTAAALENGCVRVLLVRDKQTNAAQLNAEDVLLDPAAASLDAWALRNLESGSRFEILADRVLVAQPKSVGQTAAGTYASGNVIVPFHFYKKLNFVTNYSATANPPTVAQIVDHSLHVIMISSSPNIDATGRYFARVRFVG